MIYDVSEYQHTITNAALEQVLRLQYENYTDNQHPSDKFANALMGKIGEAAWALHLGLSVDEILDDAQGPDFTHMKGWDLDVKTAKHRSSCINVRAYTLDKPNLDRLCILAATADPVSFRASLKGTITGPNLCGLPVHNPALGHSKPYIRIAWDQLTPLRPKIGGQRVDKGVDNL